MVSMRMGGPNGTLKMQAKGMTMQGLSDLLARQVGKPVVDQTGITGNYDIDLEFKQEEGMGRPMGMLMPMPRPDGGGHAQDANAETGASIFTAIQDQLGLRLEAKKGAVETIVVDSANKTPTEN